MNTKTVTISQAWFCEILGYLHALRNNIAKESGDDEALDVLIAYAKKICVKLRKRSEIVKIIKKTDGPPEHKTVPVQVWAEIDQGVADMVRHLNALPGVRTFASCQGGETYRPYVMAWWPAELDAEIRTTYDIGERGDGWAHLHPKACDATILNKEDT